MSEGYKLDKVLIFSATKEANPENTTLHYSITDWHNQVDVVFAVENDNPLPFVYNQAIEKGIEEDYDALILVHDDVILEHNPLPKLRKLFLNYGLVGVAGPSQVKLESPALWHIMGGGWDGGTIHGAVAHGTALEKRMTPFGPYPHRVVMIDGVFMALTRETFSKIKFDEDNPAGFHFYDLDYSFTCAKNGIKVGVGDIGITHLSPGLREFTPDWTAGEKWFLEKHT